MRAAPASVLFRMACTADSAADKDSVASTGRIRSGRWCWLRGGFAALFWPHQEANPEHYQYPGDHTAEEHQPPREAPGSLGSTARSSGGAVVASCPFLPTHHHPPCGPYRLHT